MKIRTRPTFIYHKKKLSEIMRETIFILESEKKKRGAMTMLKNIKKTSLFFGICIAVVLLFGGVASAATYYVAPDGHDSNPGTEAQTWKTIKKAAGTLIAGDTVYIKAGTYNERVIPQNSGSHGNYITYATYPGDTVTIDGDDIPVYPTGLFRIEQKSYIKVSGLRIENFLAGGACHGIYIYKGCDHIIIENNYINNVDGCGIYARGGSNIIIDNNEVSYTNLDPTWQQEMISLSGPDTFVVKNNHVHHSDNIGIDAKGSSSNGKIYNNHLHDCDSGIYVDGSSTKPLHDIDVYNNVVHDCLGAGFALGTETGGELENINVYNNIAYNNNDGFQIANYHGSAPDGSHMKTNIKVINNDFCDNSDVAIQITDYGEHFQDLTIRNNILSGPRWGLINFPRIVEENVNIDHNLFTAECDVLGDDYIIGDPKFVNPSEGDFHLQEDSPAIDNGLSVDAPGEDFDGNTRPHGAGYDIGAFEYVDEIVTGTISGTVTDRSTNPIQGASVSDGTRSATTDGTGSYSISDVPAGTYTVTCRKAGYVSASKDNIVVSEGAVATVEFSLTDSSPDPGLVAEWHLDAGSGDTAVDSSGNGNDGTLINNPTWVNGKVGNGLSFDGTNDYVDCGQDSSLKITGAITVEAWVKWSGDGNPYFVTKTGGSGHRSYDLSGNDEGTVEFRVGGEDCNTIKSSGTATIPTGEWVYLVGTYEPSNYVRLFVNGALVEEDTTSIPAAQGDNGLPWFIGSREGNQGWFNGVIDEVKIHNWALSAEEIMANYEAYSSNKSPFTPDNPSPSDGATEVSIDEILSWTGGDPDDEDTVTYDVYYGTSITPPLVAENQPENTYGPDTRDYSTKYYWQIVATDNNGASTEGEVWSFVTAASPGSDIVADWHLDAGSGEIAADSSGNGNDGTLVNNPTWVNGKVGNGLRFDGTNDYVDCGHDTSLKITGAITVEAWVKWSGDGNPYFVTKIGGSGSRSYDLSGNADGTVEFRVGGEDCNTIKSSGTAPIPTGEWVYLVGTYEPTSYVRLFVNGALAEEDTTSIPASQGDNGLSWYIGAREGNQGWFNGVIDEVKIHNWALSAEEIMANYEACS